MKTDLAVIGGGPAGTAAALTLLRYTNDQVLVLEGSNYGRPRPGETVSAAIIPFLEYLGVWSKIDSKYKLEAYANEASWGCDSITTRESLFVGRGNSWHLDRRAFDAALASQVSEMGGTLLTQSWLWDVQRGQDEWNLKIGGNQGTFWVSARQVIDATGRHCTFAQRIGAKRKLYDRLVGVVGYFQYQQNAGISHTLLLESRPTGWWYSAPIPGRRIVTAFMTDSDLLHEHKLQSENSFLEHLAASKYTKVRIASAELISGIHTFSVGTQIIEPCIGTGWVAVGDAACAFDPLSSLGIGHALASGIQGARIAHERLKGTDEISSAFSVDVERHFNTFLLQQRQIYAVEQRWADMPFWTRRQQSQSSTHDCINEIPEHSHTSRCE